MYATRETHLIVKEEGRPVLEVSKNSVYKLTIRPVNPLRSLDYSPGKTLFYGRELQRFLWASTTEGTKGEDA